MNSDELFSKVNLRSFSSIDARNEIVENCTSLKNGCVKILSFAEKYNFGRIEANGFLSFVKIVAKFDELLCNDARRRSLKTEQIVLITRCLRSLLDIIDEFKEQMDNECEQCSDNNLHAANSDIAFRGFTSTQYSMKELSVIFSSVGPFWLAASSQDFVNTLLLAEPFLNLSLPKALLAIHSKKSRGIRFAKSSINAHTISLLDLTDKRIYRLYVRFLYQNTSVRSITKHIQVDTLFKIAENNVLKKVEHSERKKVIRVRYIRNNCEQTPEHLLLHFHGGCFIGCNPDGHEVYLKDWAQKLRTVPILAVDYAKTAFPGGLQDVLDVYLWLITSRYAVESELGFYPKRIILSGDSAGANLALALTLILNDLRKIDTSFDIKFPQGIVCIYGVFKVIPVMSPSRILAAIDPILYQSLNLTIIAAYSGIVDCTQKQILSQSKKNKPWFRESDETVRKTMKTITDVLKHPYASPLFYQFFSDISNIPLCLVSTHYCPLLDDSVEMAKVWKGPVYLDVFDGLAHGFLQTIPKSQEAKLANDKCIERIKQILER